MPINPVLTHAVQILHELPDEYRLIAGKLATANLGPYVIDVSCNTGLFGIYSHHWKTGVDFGGARQGFQDVLNAAAARSGDFDIFYKQLRDWFTGPVPAISGAMNELGAMAHILLTITPSKLPEFRQTLSAQMKTVVDLLAGGSQQLNPIDLRLGQLLQELNGYNQSLAEIQAALQQNFDKVSRDLSDFWTDKPCGSGDGLDQLHTWQAVFKTATDLITANLSSLNAYTSQADACLAQVVGLVTNSLTEFQPVLEQLHLATDADLSKYMESLHLEIACDLWSSLATAGGSF
jgi:hypothetical protein